MVRTMIAMDIDQKANVNNDVQFTCHPRMLTSCFLVLVSLTPLLGVPSSWSDVHWKRLVSIVLVSCIVVSVYVTANMDNQLV